MTTHATRSDERAPDDALSGSLRLAAVAASLLMFAALVDSQVVAAIAPEVAAGLGAAKTRVAASVTVYSVAAACVALLLGRRARRVRPAAWLPLAAALFVAANLIAALAPNVAVFWAGRAVAGLAGGLVSALVIAALADASSYARRGKQMSGVAVSYFLAPVLGVPVGTWLAGRAGWRVVFVATAALVACAALLVRRFPLVTRDTRQDDTRGRGEDAIVRDGDAHKRSEVRDAHDMYGARASESEGGAGGVSLWRLAMRTRSTRRGIFSAFFVSGGLICLTTYLATWLSDAFQEKASEVAFVYAAAGAGAVVGGALGGALADRAGKRRVAVWGSLWMALFAFLVPTFNRGALLLFVIGATAFLAALRIAPLQALITELVTPAERARYVALRNASSQLGIAAAVVAGARAYQGWGLFGVALLSVGLTLCAWLSLRKIEDPQAGDAGARAPVVREEERGDAGDEDRAGVVVAGNDLGDAALVEARGEEASRATREAERGARPSRSSGRRVLRKVAGVVVALALIAFLVLPWLLSFAITKAGTRPDERARTDTPAAQGAQFEDVTFNSSDGIKLSGWYLPSRTHHLTVVMTHGLFRSRYETLDRGVRLWQEGYGVLLYDMRRHGKSAGEFSSVGYYERRDVEAATKFAEAREPQNRIVLFGVSMGAAATLLAAAELQNDDRLAGIISESSFTSFADTARHHVATFMPVPTFPFAPLLINFTAWRMGFRVSDFDPLAAVRKIRQPILFIGSGNDRRMPNATVLEPLYAAAQNPAKRKLVVPAATHGRAFDAAPDEYLKALTDFLGALEDNSPR
ncbi:MAG: MFS transporter [Acidobacteria bacterium]|nr:MFS transporter [Acidobacteriota bacterium]